MRIRIIEERIYDLPDLEPEIVEAIRRNRVDELQEFLSDLSDWPTESNTVSVEVARRHARATRRRAKTEVKA